MARGQGNEQQERQSRSRSCPRLSAGTGPSHKRMVFLHMDRARLQRRTLVPTAALPSTQVYSDDEGQLWHDLRHVHVKLVMLAIPSRGNLFQKI